MPIVSLLGEKWDDFDLNEVYETNFQYSLSNSAKDIGYNTTKLVRGELISVMPNFYSNNDISKVNINTHIVFTRLWNSLDKKISIK